MILALPSGYEWKWGVLLTGPQATFQLSLLLVQQEVFEWWHHMRIEFPRVPEWQHGAETPPTSTGRIARAWNFCSVRSLPLLGYTYRRMPWADKSSTQLMGRGFTPMKPLEFPFEELVMWLRLNRQYIWLHFWVARKSFLAGTKEKTLKVIFCWNMLIEDSLFSVEKPDCNSKTVSDVPQT